MGSSQSKGDSLNPTLDAQLYDENENCKFYRNKSGVQFQKYIIQNDNQNDFENRYQFRIKNPSTFLVNAYFAQPIQNSFGCTSHDQYQVVTQRIKQRLTTINNLSAQQSLNLIHKSLRGYQQIYKSNGIVLVKDDMIGFNEDNQVKVWLNSNFAINHSETQPISYKMLQEEDKEPIMVDNIIELVNSRTKRQPLWKQFMQNKYAQGKLSFKEAIFLVNNFVNNKNIILQNKIQTKKIRQNINPFSHSPSIKNHRGGIDRINSNNNNLSINKQRSPIIQIQHIERQKTSCSLDASRQIKQNTFTQVSQQNIQSLQNYQSIQYPLARISPITNNYKQPNLTMIRQKIVNGSTDMRSNISNQNKEINTKNNMIHSQSIPIRNYSPNPHNFHKSISINQSQIQLNQGRSLNKNQKSKTIAQPVVSFNSQPIAKSNNHSIRLFTSSNQSFSKNNSTISFENNPIRYKHLQKIQKVQSNLQKVSLNYQIPKVQEQKNQYILQKNDQNYQIPKVQVRKVQDIRNIIQNSSQGITQNQIYRIISSSDQQKKQQLENNEKKDQQQKSIFVDKIENTLQNLIQDIQQNDQIIQKVQCSQLQKNKQQNKQNLNQNFSQNIQKNFDQNSLEQSLRKQIQSQKSNNGNEIQIERKITQNQVKQDIIVLKKKETNISEQRQVEYQSQKRQIKNQNGNIQQNKLISSNVKIGESKISLKSNSNIKGMISYKDLRNLLQTTKQQKYD